jgi:Tol biopolymer transport system component
LNSKATHMQKLVKRIIVARLGLALVSAICLGGEAAQGTPTASPAAALTGRIVFGTRAGLWTMNADWTHRVQIIHPAASEVDFNPSWSPDGSQIVFRTSRGAYGPDLQGIGTEGIFIINADGSGERQLWPPDRDMPGGLFPDWSPASDRIAFSGVAANGHETSYTIRLEGKDLLDLGMFGEGIEWSPDGRNLMVDSHPGDGGWQVWVMNSDGSGQTQVTTAPASQQGGSGGNHTGAWSLEGRQIAFQSDRAGDYDEYLMHADGSDLRLILSGPRSQAVNTWLPDGRLVIADWNAGKELPDWYLVNADGSSKTALPQLDGVNAPFDWLAEETTSRSSRITLGGRRTLDSVSGVYDTSARFGVRSSDACAIRPCFVIGKVALPTTGCPRVDRPFVVRLRQSPCPVELGLLQSGPVAHLRAGEVSIAQIRTLELGVHQPSVHQVGPGQVRLGQVRA